MTDKNKGITLREGTLTIEKAEPGVTAKVNYVLEENGTVPSQGHDLDVGMDMYTTKDVLVMPGMMGSTMVGLGIRTQFDARVLGMILSPRSMMAKLPLMMGNTIGVIEGTFTGEIMVPLRNTFTSVVGEFAGIAFKASAILSYSNFALENSLIKDNKSDSPLISQLQVSPKIL